MIKKRNIYVIFFIVVLLSGIVSNAQQSGTLNGKTLDKVDNVAIDNITRLFSQLKGAITAITVTRDDKNELKLDIDYTGFENAYMTIAVKNKRKKELHFVSKTAFSLKGKTGPVEVSLTLSKGAPRYLILESAYLEIKIASRKGTFPRQFLYKLNKKWQRKSNSLNTTNVSEPLEDVPDAEEPNEETIISEMDPRTEAESSENIPDIEETNQEELIAEPDSLFTEELKPLEDIPSTEEFPEEDVMSETDPRFSAESEPTEDIIESGEYDEKVVVSETDYQFETAISKPEDLKTVTVYTVGFTYNTGVKTPCYWKNEERIDLPILNPEEGGVAEAIYVVENMAYTAGYIKDDMGIEIPCYWKNGERVDLSVSGSAGSGRANAIQVLGSMVYTAGYTQNEDGIKIPCYWKEGERIDLPVPDPTLNGHASAIQVTVE